MPFTDLSEGPVVPEVMLEQAISRTVPVVQPVAPGPGIHVEIQLDPLAAVLCDQAFEGLESPLLDRRVAEADVSQALAVPEGHKLRMFFPQPRVLPQGLDLAPQPELHVLAVNVVR